MCVGVLCKKISFYGKNKMHVYYIYDSFIFCHKHTHTQWKENKYIFMFENCLGRCT